MIQDIKSKDEIILIYCDSANPETSFFLDGIEYGVDGTEYLLKIHELLYPINNNIKIVYFCWNERKRENGIIEYIPFHYSSEWTQQANQIQNYLLTYTNEKKK